MSAPLTGRPLAQAVAEHWLTHRPHGYDEERVRHVLAWREDELAGRDEDRSPWQTRGTAAERLTAAARDVRLLISAIGCPTSAAEHDIADIVGRLRDLEVELVAVGGDVMAEEAAVCHALEHATFAAEEAAQ